MSSTRSHILRSAALVGLLLPPLAVSGCAQARAATPPEPPPARAPRAPRADAPREVRINVNGQTFPGFNLMSRTARTYLGVSLGDVSSPDDTIGVLIDSVEEDQPAAKAGIRNGARLVSLDGVNLQLDPADMGDATAEAVPTSRLRRILSRKNPGDTVTAVVAYGNRRDTRKIVLEESPMARTLRSFTTGRRVLGVGLSQRGSIRDTAGLMITSMTSGGAADRAGISEGDRLRSIDGVDLRVPAADAGSSDAADARVARLRRQLDGVHDSQAVKLEILSEGRIRTVTLVPTLERGFTFSTGDISNMSQEIRSNLSTTFGDLRERTEADRERAQEMREEARERAMEIRTNARERAREQVEGQREMAREQAEMAREVARAQRSAWRGDARGGDDDDDDDDDREIRGTISGTSDGTTLMIAGLTVAAIDADFAQQLGSGSEHGALVLKAHDRWSPLKGGDVILSIEGRGVRNGENLSLSFDRSRTQRIDILRGGRRQTITLPATR